MHHVKAVLDVLCAYYLHQGEPRKMNPVQISVYTDGLQGFAPAALESAARRWMQTSRFFPALSDLLEILQPKVDTQTAGHLAWACVERAIRSAGAYRGATFEDGRIGEAIRQTFGSWGGACAFDVDSPGWAIRRQTFLSIFGSLLHRGIPPVTLRGIAIGEPMVIAALPSLPIPKQLEASMEPISHADAVKTLASVGMLPSK